VARKKKVDWLSGLGAAPLPYAHVLISFLNNKDKSGREFDVEPWETQALRLQGRLFRGATSYPSRGSYRIADASGGFIDEGVMLEKTRMVVSFASEADFTEASLAEVGGFLRRFKTKTRQDSVGLVVDGEMYYL
jgi:hypothetical protein